MSTLTQGDSLSLPYDKLYRAEGDILRKEIFVTPVAKGLISGLPTAAPKVHANIKQ